VRKLEQLTHGLRPEMVSLIIEPKARQISDRCSALAGRLTERAASRYTQLTPTHVTRRATDWESARPVFLDKPKTSRL